jgi:hypothetical protein
MVRQVVLGKRKTIELEKIDDYIILLHIIQYAKKLRIKRIGYQIYLVKREVVNVGILHDFSNKVV